MLRLNKSFLRRLIFVFVFLLALFSIARVWHYGQIRPGIDFYQFWAVGQKIAERDDVDIYSDEASQRVGLEFLQRSRIDDSSSRFRWAAENRTNLEIYSTPFLYSLFGIFNSGDYERDYRIYQLFCLACTVFAIVTLSRLLRFSFMAALIFISAFTAWFEPFLTDVRVANVNQIQLGLLTLFLWFQTRHGWKVRDFLGGAVLGFSIMFKPNLVFVVLMLSISWLINRRYKKFTSEYAGIAVSVIAAFIFSGIMFGSIECWADWFAAILSAPSSIIKVTLGNFGLSMLLADWFNIDVVGFITAVSVGVAMVFAWFGRRVTREDAIKVPDRPFIEDALMVAVGCLIYVLSARLVWLHYYVLTIPMAIFILRPQGAFHQPARSRGITIRRVLGAVAIVAITINPLQALFGIRAPHGVAFMIIIGTSILFVLAMQELKSIRDTYEAVR